MATRLSQYIERAAGNPLTTNGAAPNMTSGGLLVDQQARQFLRDAITATVVLAAGDVFDSASPKYEVPKIALGDRILRPGTQAQRVAQADWEGPDTSLVTLSTELFKGEVPIGDEVFEDNIEQEGLADTIMQMITEAVGRDLEEIALKSDTSSTTAEFAVLANGGLISQLIADAQNIYDAGASAPTSYKALFAGMIEKLPVRFRRFWSSMVLYAAPTVCDGYADELGDRATQIGDANTDGKPVNRYRGIPVIEVPLLTGTDMWGATNETFDEYVILTNPMNVKVGFHRRVRIEKWRDPREGVTSYLPTVRYDVKWAQPEATVLAKNVVL